MVVVFVSVSGVVLAIFAAVIFICLGYNGESSNMAVSLGETTTTLRCKVIMFTKQRIQRSRMPMIRVVSRGSILYFVFMTIDSSINHRCGNMRVSGGRTLWMKINIY
mmetsp:Transcript_22630/g.34183  ORF Transcript_22630/g.34183 Transcript_22630/m.34183 type:complete len:107 (-) Transcript_22630:34-354(-)